MIDWDADHQNLTLSPSKLLLIPTGILILAHPHPHSDSLPAQVTLFMQPPILRKGLHLLRVNSTNLCLPSVAKSLGISSSQCFCRISRPRITIANIIAPLAVSSPNRCFFFNYKSLALRLLSAAP